MKISFWKSTRARLILLVFLVAVPAFLLQAVGAWIDLQQNISVRKQDAGQIVVRAQGKFETLMNTSRTVFTELVRLTEMRTPENCTLIFNDLRLAYERLAPDVTNVGLSDANGNIYCAVNPVFGNKSIADQPHFLRAVETTDMAIGDYTLNPATGLPTLSIAYPVLSFDGKVQTVIFINYEMIWLENWQKEVALPPDTSLTIINPEGIILRRYLNSSIIPIEGNASQMKWFAPLQTGQSGLEAPDLDGVNRLHTLAPLQLGTQTAAWLHLGYPVAQIYSHAEQSLAWRLTLLGTIFILALGLAWWGSEVLFLHPLNSLMRVVEKVQRGDLSARAASIPAVGELTGLAESFDRMAEALQERESAQRQAQIELQQSEERFYVAFGSTAIGMGLLGLDGRILQVNEAVCKMSGYTEAELLQRYDYENVFSEDREVGQDLYVELLNGKRASASVEKRYQRKGGEVFWTRLTLSLVHNPDGSPAYYVGLISDIDSEKRAQAKLAEQEAEYRRTLEQRVEERTHELAEANQRLMDEIDQRKRAEEALSLKAAEDAVTAERTRLARDLHDAVTQTLFSASIMAEVLPDLWQMDAEEAKKSTEELSQLTRGALAEMRTLLLELRPAALTQSRLNDLIRQLCEALIGRARLPIKFISEGDRTLPPEVQVAFYRIAQESLNNVFKYARATQVKVGLFLTPAGAHLEVCDDGIGFDVSSSKPTSLGMRIMRERAEAIGAELSINSKPGEGVCLDLTWTEKPDMKLSVFKS